MKKKVFMLFFAVLFAASFTSAWAQVTYSQDWENSTAGLAGWTNTGTGGTFARNTTAPCAGLASARANIYVAGNIRNFVSPLLGTSNGGLTTLTFDYKVVLYSNVNTGAPCTDFTIGVEWATALTGPYTSLGVINCDNHTVASTCAQGPDSYRFTPNVGDPVYVRFVVTRLAGDNYYYFDNVSVQEEVPPCVGTPTPGNTISSVANTCPGVAFNLSLQNATAGSGVTYQWQNATSIFGPWNNFGTSVATLSTSQTDATYYRCQVTCDGNTGISTPVQVQMEPWLNCYCTTGVGPTSAADSDLFRVQITGPGTTFDHNVGCTGVLGVQNFVGLGLISLMQGMTYTMTITMGQCGTGTYSNVGKVWIDYAQNAVYDEPGERLGVVSGATSSAGVAYSFDFTVPAGATLGETRMRVMQRETTDAATVTPCVSFSWGSVHDYGINIVAPVGLIPPTGLAASNIGLESADLNWTENNTPAATQWELVYGSVGFDPDLATPVSVSSKPYTLENLDDATTYQWYVRSVVPDTRAVSVWSGASQFSTLAGPVSSFPWSENFDALTFPPAYWTTINDDGSALTWARSTAQFHSTPASALHQYGASGFDEEGWLITPAIAIPGSGAFNLSFWSYNTWPADYGKNSVLISTTGTAATDFTEVWTTATVTSTWVQTLVPLLGYEGETIYIAFRYEGVFAHGWHLDDVEVFESFDPDLFVNPSSFDYGYVLVGNCAGPQNFTISNIGAADLTVTGLTLNGTDAAAFTLVDGNAGNYPILLTPGQALPNPVTVEFCPNIPDSFFDVFMQVSSDWETEEVWLFGIGNTGDAPVCPVGNVIWSQTANVAGWNAATSELDAGFGIDYKGFDNYSVMNNITDIRFWGLQLIYDAGFTAGDTENPTEFLIEFWNNNAGVPDNSAPVYAETVSLTGTPLQDVGGYALWQWDYTFAAPVTLLNGWVSIQGQTAVANDNWFMWMNSTGSINGDAASQQWTGAAFSALAYDLSFCFIGAPSQPTVPENVVIAVNGTTGIVTVTWTHVPGQDYFVYASDAPAYTGTWTDETANGVLTNGQWVSNAAMGSKKFIYVTTDYSAKGIVTSGKKIYNSSQKSGMQLDNQGTQQRIKK